MVDSNATAFSFGSYPADLDVSGVVIPFDPAVITPAIRAAMEAGRYETEEAAALAAAVEPGDRVVEIGAGIGFISTLLARDRRVASVLAVEANPHLLPYMARLHACNRVRKVRRLNAVLAPGGSGTATFYLRRDFWMGSLAPGPNPWQATVEVPVRDLDAVLRDEAASLVVCDVEGAEAALFAEADLAGVDRVLLELHDHVTGLSGVGAVFAALAARGLVYDPRHSAGSVVLFRRLRDPDVPRPYAG